MAVTSLSFELQSPQGVQNDPLDPAFRLRRAGFILKKVMYKNAEQKIVLADTFWLKSSGDVSAFKSVCVRCARGHIQLNYARKKRLNVY